MQWNLKAVLKAVSNFFIVFGAVVLCLFPVRATAQAIPADNSSAVILAYHRIGEDSRPETSLRLDQFKAHIEELARGEYTVLPLPEILQKVRAFESLPEKTVAITLQGAYKSALDKAAPLLLARDMPFTIIYAGENSDRGDPQYAGWSDLKRLASHDLVSLAVLPSVNARIYDKEEAEMRRYINKARQRHREEFGAEPIIFVYPFGEYTSGFKNLARQAGFSAALSLNSGALYAGSDFMTIPRFSLTENFGTLERLRLIARALPLPASDIEPHNPVISEDQPLIGFTLDKTLVENQSGKLRCFISGQAPPHIEKIGPRIEIRPVQDITDERTRVNCTLPAGENTWRWWGMLLLNK